MHPGAPEARVRRRRRLAPHRPLIRNGPDIRRGFCQRAEAAPGGLRYRPPDRRRSARREPRQNIPHFALRTLSNRFLAVAKVINSFTMNPFAKHAEPFEPAADPVEPLDLTPEQAVIEPTFDPGQWEESRSEERGSGGRQVLGTGLIILAALWVGYIAWSAGRTLAGQPLSSPAVAQWIALAAGPLALMGLIWLMFGRTRRKEAERFTQSVVTMRTEARSLEALLEVLSQRISDSRSELTMISQHLMQLGDDATGKLGGITREFDSSTEKLARHGEALDRAAAAARTDIAVLLDDLPRAEAAARSIAEQLRSSGAETATRTSQFGEQVTALANRARETDQSVSEASERLASRLTEIESAGAAAAARVGEAEASFSGALSSLL